MWQGLRKAAIGSATLGFLLGVLSASIYFAHGQPQTVSPAGDIADHEMKMTRCIDRIIDITQPPKLNVGMYERIWRICGNQIFNALYLTDFGIRKEKFVQQELDERVNLWMVVAITISGVLLAGIQLFLSYRLAERGRGEFAKDSELAVQSNRISLRSSVTGAIILGLSFAFFMVYVLWIYSIHEVPVGRPKNLEIPLEQAFNEESIRPERPAGNSNQQPGSDSGRENKNEARSNLQNAEPQQ